jgi:predicted nucleic acid-binding protein
MEAYMSQFTLRQIPARVERQLRLQARKSGKSLNKTAVALETGSRLITYDWHFNNIPGLVVLAP